MAPLTPTEAQCPNCWTRMTVDPDEDGWPSVPSRKCADPECEIWLCFAGCEHLSAKCDGCDHRFCNEHLHILDDGTNRPLKLCTVCYAESDEPWPQIPILTPITLKVGTVGSFGVA